MIKNGKKGTRTFSISPELDEYVAQEAKKGFRSYSRQVEMMLVIARHAIEESETEASTQFDHAALADSSLLERVR